MPTPPKPRSCSLRPELVDTDKMRDADDPDRTEGSVFRYAMQHVSTNGVTGFPSRATKSMGLDLWQDVVAAARDVVERAHGEKPPLGKIQSIGRPRNNTAAAPTTSPRADIVNAATKLFSRAMPKRR